MQNISTESMGGGKAPKKSMAERINDINKMEMPVLLRNMRMVNLVLAAFQVIAGFSGLFSFLTLNFTGTLVSIYVILLGVIFFFFELRIKKMDERIRRNFGFLYSYKGRAAFIFFVGFLDFGMSSTLGYVAGILMCLNALGNLMILCRHSDFQSGEISSSSDPTAGYSTGNKEAANYLSNNPELAKSAGKMAFSAAMAGPRTAKV